MLVDTKRKLLEIELELAKTELELEHTKLMTDLPDLTPLVNGVAAMGHGIAAITNGVVSMATTSEAAKIAWMSTVLTQCGVTDPTPRAPKTLSFYSHIEKPGGPACAYTFTYRGSDLFLLFYCGTAANRRFCVGKIPTQKTACPAIRVFSSNNKVTDAVKMVQAELQKLG